MTQENRCRFCLRSFSRRCGHEGYAVFGGVKFVLDERAGITALRMMAREDNGSCVSPQPRQAPTPTVIAPDCIAVGWPAAAEAQDRGARCPGGVISRPHLYAARCWRDGTARNARRGHHCRRAGHLHPASAPELLFGDEEGPRWKGVEGSRET